MSTDYRPMWKELGLARLRSADPAPISGLDGLLMNQAYFYDDPARFTGSVNAICDELEQRIGRKDGVAPKETPRIVISGCPSHLRPCRGRPGMSPPGRGGKEVVE